MNYIASTSYQLTKHVLKTLLSLYQFGTGRHTHACTEGVKPVRCVYLKKREPIAIGILSVLQHPTSKVTSTMYLRFDAWYKYFLSCCHILMIDTYMHGILVTKGLYTACRQRISMTCYACPPLHCIQLLLACCMQCTSYSI